jgi:uncharacterized protein with von Willebrand factor type A (vWA) domain
MLAAPISLSQIGITKRSPATDDKGSLAGTTSIGVIRRIAEDRMFPLTLDGIDRAMRRLKRRG